MSSPDAPYPELKRTHTAARVGRPWRDRKPPPAAPVWGLIQGFGAYWALVAAVDLGVFDAVDRHGPVGLPALAAELDVSAPHLQHLTDVLVTFGLLERRGAALALTETAERYLCTRSEASMVDLVRVAPGPHQNWSELAATVRRGEVAAPIEDDPAAFYRPLVRATFATQLRAATRLGHRLGWARRPGLRVLDLGAGAAPWAIAVLEQSPGSTAVVNDLPGVIGEAEATLRSRELTGRARLVAGDFLAIDVEPAAFDVVVLGHVCRTEGDERSRALVGRARDALVPGGQLIVADYFADNERSLAAFGLLMGLTMLANTRRGGTVTHAQVYGWLHEAGFEAVRLLEPIGFQFVYVAAAPRTWEGRS